MPVNSIRPATKADIVWIVREEQRPDFAAFLHRWLREQHERNLADADKPYLIALDEAQERTAFVILAGTRLGSLSTEPTEAARPCASAMP